MWPTAAPADLLAAMQAASDRDLVARQYVTGFSTVLDQVLPWLLAGPGQGWSLADTIVHTQLRLLSRFGDSLIARKCGPAVSRSRSPRGRAECLRRVPGYCRLPTGLSRSRLLAAQRSSSTQPGHDCRLDRRRVVCRVARRLITSPFLSESTTMPESYSVRLQKECHVFSAAHFITYSGNICEPLHGHNYRVWVEVEGPLDENQYVVDFIVLRDALQSITQTLDHHMLLPTSHPQIHVDASERGGGGDIRGPAVGVSAQRVRAVARGQHDGRTAGAGTSVSSCWPNCSTARGCARTSCGWGSTRATTNGASASCDDEE